MTVEDYIKTTLKECLQHKATNKTLNLAARTLIQRVEELEARGATN